MCSIRLELHNHFGTFASLAETVFSKLSCEASWINKIVCFPGIIQPKAAGVSRTDKWLLRLHENSLLPLFCLGKGLLPANLVFPLISQLFFACFPRESCPSQATPSFCVDSSPERKALQGSTQKGNITVDFEKAIDLWVNQSFCKLDVFHYFVFNRADRFIQAFTC